MTVQVAGPELVNYVYMTKLLTEVRNTEGICQSSVFFGYILLFGTQNEEFDFP